MSSITIIGGGVIGLSIANEISNLFKEIYVIDKEKYLGEHASGRSSQVNHAGIYYKPSSLKAKLCVEGNELIKRFCEKYEIPFQNIGKLVIARNNNEESELEKLLLRSKENNVPNVKLISKKEVKELEPNVNCQSALYVPTSGIFDTGTYLKKLESLIKSKDVEIVKSTKVTNIQPKKKYFIIEAETEGHPTYSFETDFIINAAGLFSDKIANFLNPNNNYYIKSVRGESALFYQNRTDLKVKMNVYPVPHNHIMDNGEITYTTGVHLTPTIKRDGLDKTVTIGPLLVNPSHTEDYRLKSTVENFHQRIVSFFPNLRLSDIKYYQSGNSAKLSNHKDFLIKRDEQFSRCIHLLGIDSPGLTASLAIGKYVRKLLKDDQK